MKKKRSISIGGGAIALCGAAVMWFYQAELADIFGALLIGIGIGVAVNVQFSKK